MTIPRPFSQPYRNPLQNINLSLSTSESTRKLPANSVKVMAATNQSIRQFVSDVQRQRLPLNKDTVGSFNKVMYDLYTSKLRAKKDKENISNYSEVSKSIDECINTALSLYVPAHALSSVKQASFIFEEIVRLILTDIDEEIVGQKRLPGAIPALVSKALAKKFNLKMTPKMRQSAATLYPVALLTATMDPKAKIPDKNNELVVLNRDKAKNQILKLFGYKSQFGQDVDRRWDADFFGNSLQAAWHQKREDNS